MKLRRFRKARETKVCRGHYTSEFRYAREAVLISLVFVIYNYIKYNIYCKLMEPLMHVDFFFYDNLNLVTFIHISVTLFIHLF